VISGVAGPGGAELGPIALVLGMGKIRLPDTGASISLALDQHQRWEWSKIRLPDAGASVTPALKKEQKWLPNAGASIAMAFEERRR
jgi:hypothetical protein